MKDRIMETGEVSARHTEDLSRRDMMKAFALAGGVYAGSSWLFSEDASAHVYELDDWSGLNIANRHKHRVVLVERLMNNALKRDGSGNVVTDPLGFTRGAVIFPDSGDHLAWVRALPGNIGPSLWPMVGKHEGSGDDTGGNWGNFSAQLQALIDDSKMAELTLFPVVGNKQSLYHIVQAKIELECQHREFHGALKAVARSVTNGYMSLTQAKQVLDELGWTGFCEELDEPIYYYIKEEHADFTILGNHSSY